jgi:hypothetical protein
MTAFEPKRTFRKLTLGPKIAERRWTNILTGRQRPIVRCRLPTPAFSFTRNKRPALGLLTQNLFLR